jgi:hypothetical protein
VASRGDVPRERVERALKFLGCTYGPEHDGTGILGPFRTLAELQAWRDMAVEELHLALGLPPSVCSPDDIVGCFRG